MLFPLKTSFSCFFFFFETKNPRANTIKRCVSRASDGIPASRGGLSNGSRAFLMCSLLQNGEKEHKKAHEASKKKTETRDILGRLASTECIRMELRLNALFDEKPLLFFRFCCFFELFGFYPRDRNVTLLLLFPQQDTPQNSAQ